MNGGRHHAEQHVAIVDRAMSSLETVRHSHPPQHFNVVVNLKLTIKVEHVRPPTTPTPQHHHYHHHQHRKTDAKLQPTNQSSSPSKVSFNLSGSLAQWQRIGLDQ